MSPSPLHGRLDVWGGGGGSCFRPQKDGILQFPLKPTEKEGPKKRLTLFSPRLGSNQDDWLQGPLNTGSNALLIYPNDPEMKVTDL